MGIIQPSQPALNQLLALARQASQLGPEEIAAKWADIQDELVFEEHCRVAVPADKYDKYIDAMASMLASYPELELGARVEHVVLATDAENNAGGDKPATAALHQTVLKACTQLKSLKLIGRGQPDDFQSLWERVLARAPLDKVEALAIDAKGYRLDHTGLLRFTALHDLDLIGVGLSFLTAPVLDHGPTSGEVRSGSETESDDESLEEDEDADDASSTASDLDGHINLNSLELTNVGDLLGRKVTSLSATSLARLLRLAGPALTKLDFTCSATRGLERGAILTVPFSAPQLETVSLTLTRANVKHDLDAVWVLLGSGRLQSLELQASGGSRKKSLAALSEARRKLSKDARAKVKVRQW